MVPKNEINGMAKSKKTEIAEFITGPPINKQPLSKENLTKKERIIARCLLLGKCRSEIAKALSVSENTVKTHTKNIFKKTNVKNQKIFMIMFIAE